LKKFGLLQNSRRINNKLKSTLKTLENFGPV